MNNPSKPCGTVEQEVFRSRIMCETEHKDLPTLCEAMIDKYGLFEVMVTLDLICGDKAAHIRANGGPDDNRLARRWDDAAKVLHDASADGRITLVSP